MKITTKSTFTGIIFGLLIGTGISISLNVSAFKSSDDTSSSMPVSQLKKFSEVMARIQRDYVEEVDQDKLITDAIRGMLTGLDPHSAYLDSDEFKELQVDTSGKFGGLGIEVGMENGFVKVISPIDDTPAARAGIKAGDLIIRLDDEQVKGKTLNEAVRKMRGKPGEPIVLTIVREGEPKPLKIKIVRDIIKIQSVKSKLLEANYGYLRISSFQANTSDTARAALQKLKKENNGNLKGLVMDLRNNPGGVLGAAVGVSDLFLKEGNIVETKGRIDDSQMSYDATNSDLIEGAPIVVLVNQGSASASEIVSGALQDHHRAIILGEKTFGKGSVQTVLPLDATTALKLTTARYYTPSGRSIQAKGIEPDIIVEQLTFEDADKKAEDDSLLEPLTEAGLSGHLENTEAGDKAKDKQESGSEKGNDSTEAETEKDEKKLAREDYQLFEALNLLKGMNLIQTKADTK